jgi:hypothetical protein
MQWTFNLITLSSWQVQRYKQQKEEAEIEGATFQPEISRLAQSLWSATELQQAPAWQRLSNQSKKIKGEAGGYGGIVRLQHPCTLCCYVFMLALVSCFWVILGTCKRALNGGPSFKSPDSKHVTVALSCFSLMRLSIESACLSNPVSLEGKGQYWPTYTDVLQVQARRARPKSGWRC